MNLLFVISLLFASTYSTTLTCRPRPEVVPSPVTEEVISDEVPVNSNSEDNSRYPSGGSCASGGSYGINEFGASTCEYSGDTCDTVKYFSYANGGNGVELCCSSNSDCNYDPIKNYCPPDLKRCVDGSYKEFNCSEKGGPIFDRCSN